MMVMFYFINYMYLFVSGAVVLSFNSYSESGIELVVISSFVMAFFVQYKITSPPYSGFQFYISWLVIALPFILAMFLWHGMGGYSGGYSDSKIMAAGLSSFIFVGILPLVMALLSQHKVIGVRYKNIALVSNWLSLSLFSFIFLAMMVDDVRGVSLVLFMPIFILPLFFNVIYLSKSRTPSKTRNTAEHRKIISENEMITIEKFSEIKNIEVSTIIEMIRDGFYSGRLIEGQWYVYTSEI